MRSRARLTTVLLVGASTAVVGAGLFASAPASASAPAIQHRCTITGTAGDDVLKGTESADVICGLGGNDELYGVGGNDILIGGTGADRLYGGRGDDELHGGAGRDYLQAEAGHDVLRGGPGDDTLLGGDGDDDVRGGPGDDSSTVALADGQNDVTVNISTYYPHLPQFTGVNWHYERPSGNCLKDYQDFSSETPPRYGGFQILTTNSGTGPTSSCFYEESYGWWTITARDSHGNKIGDGQILVKAGNGSSGSFAQIDCHYFSGVTCSAGRVTGSQPTVTVTIDK